MWYGFVLKVRNPEVRSRQECFHDAGDYIEEVTDWHSYALLTEGLEIDVPILAVVETRFSNALMWGVCERE